MAVVCALGYKQAAASLTVRLLRTVTLALRARAPTKRTHQPNKSNAKIAADGLLHPPVINLQPFNHPTRFKKTAYHVSDDRKKTYTHPSRKTDLTMLFLYPLFQNARTLPSDRLSISRKTFVC